MSEKESAKPIAYRFKNNRGNGNFEYDYYDADEVSSAYRDNCIEITPLYCADRIDQLEKELVEAWKDAERYRWLRNDCSQTMCRELFGVEGAEDELDEAIDEAIEAEWEGSVRFAAIDKAIKQETP